MRAPLRTRLPEARGAALVQVSAALAALMALNALVVDYGLQLVGRNEIQTAVDAAALAGATSLAFESYGDRSATGPAVTAARAVADENLVRSEAASVEAADVGFPVCASTYEAASSGSPKVGCVQVTAYRTAGRSNPIPVLFANLLGVASYGVAATATAEAKDANATDCLKPLAVPDRWTERYPVSSPNSWSASSTFDRYDPSNPGALLPPASRDAYTSPNQIGAGTGVLMTGVNPNQVWFGSQVTLQPGSLSTPISTIRPWTYLPVGIPDSLWGANAVRQNTSTCAAAAVSIGDRLDLAPGGVAANAPLVGQGLSDLVALDPGAVWSSSTQTVVNSCADVLNGPCGSMSPRIVAVALYDPYELAEESHAGGATGVRVRNIVGLFIESVSGSVAVARITRHPGLLDPDAITLYDASSFLRASLLVE